MMRKLAIILTALAVITLLGAPSAAAADDYGPTIRGHVQNIGWVDSHKSASHPGAVTVGTSGRSLRLEALALPGAVQGEGYLKGSGWVTGAAVDCADGCTTIIGTTGKGIRMEAVRLTSDLYPGIRCQAHVQNVGWIRPVGAGEVCGTTGRSLRLEAVRIWFEAP